MSTPLALSHSTLRRRHPGRRVPTPLPGTASITPVARAPQFKLQQPTAGDSPICQPKSGAVGQYYVAAADKASQPASSARHSQAPQRRRPLEHRHPMSSSSSSSASSSRYGRRIPPPPKLYRDRGVLRVSASSSREGGTRRNVALDAKSSHQRTEASSTRGRRRGFIEPEKRHLALCNNFIRGKACPHQLPRSGESRHARCGAAFVRRHPSPPAY
eukprot:COSAG06_NODE_129_length_22602_cov_7.116318_12_plen_215_part_00